MQGIVVTWFVTVPVVKEYRDNHEDEIYYGTKARECSEHLHEDEAKCRYDTIYISDIRLVSIGYEGTGHHDGAHEIE
jgi:hypothetical protein